MLAAGRSVKAGMQAKAARSSSVGPRLAARHASRVSRSITDKRRALVTVAAAESDAAPVAEQAAAPVAKRSLASIQPNEVVEGRVTAIQSFGAFVDIGAEAQGLVHVSQLADGFVKNVADVIKIGDVVKVKVLSVDVDGKRLALSRKGLAPRPAAAAGPAAGDEVEEVVAEEETDPNSAEVDGLGFLVEDADEGADDEELDPADIEFVEDIPAEVAREIAIACEDLVTGTVQAVDANGVTVRYTLSDGTPVEGVIAAAELLAPAYLVEGEDSADEAEEYVEVDNINPTQYYKVGDAISCAVYDVEEGGVPLLTQRLPEEADDELAELAEEMDQIDDVDEMSDALLIQGLWAAAEQVDEDEDGPAENADLMLEELAPLQAVAAAAEDEEVSFQASTAPDDLRSEILVSRMQASGSIPSNLMAGAALNLPNRSIGFDASQQVTGALLDEYGNSQVDYDDVDEDELIGVSVANSSYIPRRLLKRIGYKLAKDEESGEWEAVEREGADQIEISAGLAAELESYALGTAVDPRDVDAIVRDLLAADEDLEEAELPIRARRNPVVAAAAVSAGISAAEVKALRTKTGAGMMDCKKALAECGGDADKAVEWLRQKGLSGADKKAGRVAAEGAIVRYIHPGSRLGVLLEVNCETDFVAAGEAFTGLANELAMVVASSDVVCVAVEDMPGDLLAKEREVEMGKEDLKSKPEAVRSKIVEGRLDKIKKQYALLEQPALRDNNKTVGELIKETIAATGENIQVRRFVKFNLGEGLEKKSNDFAAEVAQQTQKKDAAPAAAAAAKPAEKEQPKQQEPAAAAKPAVQVSAAQVKQLRDKSGAGMMDCKKALAECGGDVEAASEWLRKKGLASADKKAGRLAAEGGVLAYIHPGSRLGVLLEVNCETDFVAAGEVFNKLANTLAMQIAASTVEYVAPDEIPAEVFEKEKEIEMGREDLQSKPEAIRAKIAEGRVKKLVQERVLLEQPYLLDQNKTVAEAVKEAIASCGENIQVRRFVRFTLGEGIEKKESNLAAEVAAATGGKA